MQIAEPKEQSLSPEDNERCFQILEPLARALKPALTPTEVKKAIQWAREKAQNISELVSIGVEKLGLALFKERGTLKELIHAASLSPTLIVSDTVPILLLESKGGKVLVLATNKDAEWVDHGSLGDRLGYGSGSNLITWQRIQNLTPLQSKESPEQRSYLSRLLQLVAMERRDLRTVFVFAMAIGLLNLATPIAVEALVNTVAFGGLLQPVIILSLMLMTCLALGAALSAFQAFVVELLQRRLFVRLSCELGERLPHVPNESFDTKYGPELVNRFFDVLTVQKVGAKFLLDTVTVILSATLGLLILAFYHPILLAFDFALILMLFFIVAVLGRGCMKTSLKESSAKYAVAEWLEELARHHTTFKGSAHLLARDQVDNLTRNYLEKRATHYRIVFRQLLASLALQVLASTALLGLGGWLVEIGQLTLGQLVASWLIVSIIVGSIAKLGFQLESFYDLLTSAVKIGTLLDLPSKAHPGISLPHNSEGLGIEAVGLSLGYPGHSPFQSNLNISCKPGERIGIVGRSGSGKTTLLEVLAGHREPVKGHILLDSLDLRELDTKSLLIEVLYAAPDQIFAGTVRENIAMGKTDVTTPVILKALEAVELLDEIRNLPKGLETKLTTRGQPLSTGQINRLILARALVQKPRLLLIDRLLDGLEQEQRKTVFDHLTAPEYHWTLLLASQNPNIVGLCERVVNLTKEGHDA